MPRIKLSVKTNSGVIEILGETPKEILETLNLIDKDFIKGVNSKVSEIITLQTKNKLDDILGADRNGPVIITKKAISHYQAIGLILYAHTDNIASSKDIRERLTASGKKVAVPARLNEMTKRGHVFKPDAKSSVYKLSTMGLKWIEDEVLTKLFEEDD
jgi:TusA-related sulfurtransferase